MPRLGAAHHNARLSDAQVHDMRNLYQSWKAAKANKGYSALGEIFGCSMWTARDIVTYRTRFASLAQEVRYQPDDYDLTQRDEI